MPDQPRVHNVVNGHVTGMVVQAGEVVIARVPPPPRQLPAAPARFVGRAGDLADLAGGPGVHVIAGIGGIGKTWLAVHWAHTHRHRFPDGQLFVDLRGFSPDRPMVPAVAVRGFLDALGAVDVPPDPHAQVALYRSLTADKRLLVVLDNAADAVQVEPLLPGGSSCSVLVTSRRRLSSLNTRHGAVHLRLGVLGDAESRDLLAARLGSARVASDPAAVRRIVEHCAGLPLALAVVGSRGQMDPETSLARIADELGRLDDEDPANSVPAALSWSLRALTKTQSRLLGLLAAAPGPDIGLAALASLAGPESDLPALERLCLLERVAGGRYRMHDLLRAQVRAEDVEATRRVIDHYLYTADSADRRLQPYGAPAELPPMSRGCRPEALSGVDAALAWFDAEHQCLLAAVDTAAEHGWHDVVWHLARTLTTYHHRRDHADADIRTWGLALRARTPSPALITSHRRLGEALTRAHRNAEGLTHLREAGVLAARSGDLYQLSHTHRALAWALGRQDENAEAVNHAQENLRLSRELRDTISEAHALNAVAWFTARLGDLDRARSFGEAALALGPNPEGEASCRETLAHIEYLAHRPAESIEHYERALTLRRSHGYLRHRANTLDRMVAPLRALGRDEEAEARSREARELFARLRE
ncbi:ATP-binding protein [Amycolatopsis sp. CA-126428]|uniref:ATP-binding protein n=1 Tax=Amycolatopsis sp. CA-126428 TaxID=2073158 RepID=UPI000CD26053|nr:tetratricopeptide repeat protein [Amycolatopsis sp. CA-126428]